MHLSIRDPSSVWREDAAIWEILAGELVVQREHPLANNAPGLIQMSALRADEGAKRVHEDDLNRAGHALIGCSVALALAVRSQTEETTPIEHFASELAASVSWQASRPAEPDVVRLAEEIRRHCEPGFAGSPSLWELGLRAGAYAAGLSPHIVRRDQRRDLLRAVD